MPKAKSATRADAIKQKQSSTKRLPKLSNLTLVLLGREYYRANMPAKKSHRVAVWVAFLVVWSILVAQFLYPADRAVPFATIGSERVGYASHEDMARQLTDMFSKTKVTLKRDSKTVSYPLATTGAELNTELHIATLRDYPFWQRFIPLSILWQMPHVEHADVYYTDAVLRRFSDQASKTLSTSPVNARLAIKDGTLVAVPEKQGGTVTSAHIHDRMGNEKLLLGRTTTIVLHAKQIPAERTMNSFAAVRSQAENALQRTIIIAADDKTITPSKADIASWLILDTDSADKPTFTIDRGKVMSYIAEFNKQVGVAPGMTNINIVDGREAGRTNGPSGRAIDSEKLVTQISAYVLDGQGKPQMNVVFIDLPPSIIYNNKYTATQEGLRAYVADQGRTKNVRIDIRQIDGSRWTASTRANESTVSASTYKLFVSLMLFDKMKRGETSWSDPMLDTTVSTCFDRMTIASTNPCAEKWLAQWGRSNVNTFLYSRGFSTGTTFTSTVANHSTAADLTTYMVGLNDGSIVEEPYRSRLLHSLSVHPYRSGIPAGSKGKVYDKVGFLWDYIHDAAIIKHPRGTYAMTIMTKGQSYAAIANMTREIERIMYP